MREVCSSCGTERQLDAKFCGNCGASFEVAANRDESAPTTDGRTPVWVWILSAGAGLAGLLAIALVALVLVSDSDEPVASEIFLERSTDPGENPFTPSVDTYMAGAAPTGERELDAEPAAIAAATETPAEMRTVSGAEPGVFAASGTETLCDGQALVTHLEADQERAAAWAGVIGIEPSTIPDYVGRLTPLALARDTRVTNYALVDGEAMPLDSVFEAGTTVMVDELGVPRVRCSCGNPLTAAEPVEGSVSYVGSAWSDFEPAETVSIAPADAPVTEFAVDDLSGPPEITARLPLGFVNDVAVGHGSVWAVTGRSLFRIARETNEVEAEIPLGSEATQASVLATEDEVLVGVGHFVRDGSPVWLDLLGVNPKTNEVTSSERLFEDDAGTPMRGIQDPHLASGSAGTWIVNTGGGSLDQVSEDGRPGESLPGITLTADEVTALAVTDTAWLGSREGLERSDPDKGSLPPVAIGADAVSSLWASGDEIWAGVAGESDVHDTGLRLAAGTGEILRIHGDGTVTDRFAVGDPPYALAASEDGLVWVATGPAFTLDGSGGGGSALARLDPSTRQVSQGADLGAIPNAVATTADAVWVATEDGLVRAAAYSQIKVRAATAARAFVLGADGIAGVPFGMDGDEAVNKLTSKLEGAVTDDTVDTATADLCEHRDGRTATSVRWVDIMAGDTEIGMYVPDGVFTGYSVKGSDAGFRTAEGAGLGSTESDLRRIYGDRIELSEAPLGDTGDWIGVLGDDWRSSITFGFRKGGPVDYVGSGILCGE